MPSGARRRERPSACDTPGMHGKHLAASSRGRGNILRGNERARFVPTPFLGAIVPVPQSEPSIDESFETVARAGDVLLDKYRIERILGRGGMGFVAEAWHLQLDERVAIKFLLPSLAKDADAVARFEREARVLFKLKSPHVCRVLDVAKGEHGAPFLVMEFLEGHDLSALLTERQGSPIADAVDYVVQACEAVGEAHARGIVHRDIKPENLFLAKSPEGLKHIKVLDFGLSKVAAAKGAKRERTLTNTGQSMGTPDYMSPEQWLSTRDVGPATDQWALAAILYELITGYPPFEGESLPMLCTQVLHGTSRPLHDRRPDAPAALDAILTRAFIKNPQGRFANVGRFAEAIAPFGSQDSVAKAARLVRMFEQLQATEDHQGAVESEISLVSRALLPEFPPPAPSSPVGNSSASQGKASAVGSSTELFPAPPAPTAAVSLRGQTGQSWQQPTLDEVMPARARPKLALYIGGAVAALTLAAVSAVLSSGGSTEPASAAALADGSAATNGATPTAEPTATASADVPAVASATSAPLAATTATAAVAAGTSTPAGTPPRWQAPPPRQHQATPAKAPPPPKPKDLHNHR